MPQRNLAVELLEKLLKGEISSRMRKNVVQARSFADMLEQTIHRYQNRTIWNVSRNTTVKIANFLAQEYLVFQ